MSKPKPNQSSELLIETVEGTDRLAPGTWVIDANGKELCLVNTHMGFAQRMWLVRGRIGLMVHLRRAAYPVHVAKLVDPSACKHRHGTNELGHCYVCGQVCEAPRGGITFDAEQMEVFRAAAQANARWGVNEE